jgi:tetratricopeptide (TPR) repeat protein
MKKLLLLFTIAYLPQILLAQTIVVDKEKLLELYQSQRYAEAAKYLQNTYPANTTDLKALGQIAYCQLMAGQLANAAQSYLAIKNINPSNLNALFNLASINAKRGNNPQAKFYLEEIIKIDSTNFNALKQLANFTDSVPARIAYLQKANLLQPADADVASDLAAILRLNKMIEQAYQVLKTAIVADTGNFILQQELLPNAIDLKKYNEVIAVGEKLLLIDQDVNVLKDLGKAYYFVKNYQKCLVNYQVIEQMGRQNEMSLYYMTLCYRELKNYPMAAIYAKKTIDEAISPNTATYYAMLGTIYELNNQFISSSNAYKKGLTFNANSNLYYRLALLNDLKLKKPTSALTYYHSYLNSKPDEKTEKEQIEYVSNRILALKKK